MCVSLILSVFLGVFFMRVITGSARGRRLHIPQGYDIRPTADRVKEAVFSSLQFDIENAVFLDLFAGSGQMGIEALSRGAKSAVFVDESPKAIESVKINLDNTRLKERAIVRQCDSIAFINGCRDSSFDIIFIDPPYNFGTVQKILPTACRKVSPDGFVVCEYESTAPEPVAPDGFILKKLSRYGKTNIAIFVPKSERGVDI